MSKQDQAKKIFSINESNPDEKEEILKRFWPQIEKNKTAVFTYDIEPSSHCS